MIADDEQDAEVGNTDARHLATSALASVAAFASALALRPANPAGGLLPVFLTLAILAVLVGWLTLQANRSKRRRAPSRTAILTIAALIPFIYIGLLLWPEPSAPFVNGRESLPTAQLLNTLVNNPDLAIEISDYYPSADRGEVSDEVVALLTNRVVSPEQQPARIWFEREKIFRDPEVAYVESKSGDDVYMAKNVALEIYPPADPMPATSKYLEGSLEINGKFEYLESYTHDDIDTVFSIRMVEPE